MARDPVIKSTKRTRPATVGEASAYPPIKVEIVFITVMEDWVAVMTRCIHQSDPTPASTKVNRVLPARQPAAVTYMIELHKIQRLCINGCATLLISLLLDTVV